MRVIRQSECIETPWKNGGGLTREAIRVPATEEPYRWRLSFARIDRSGPFSDFGAYHRTLVLLEGGGAVLSFANGGRRVLKGVGDLVRFDGAHATQCELIDGACVDLNLITAKTLGEVRACVHRLEAPLGWPLAAGEVSVIVPLEAPLELAAGGRRERLERLDVAVLEATDAPSARAAAAASAPLVFIASFNGGGAP